MVGPLCKRKVAPSAYIDLYRGKGPFREAECIPRQGRRRCSHTKERSMAKLESYKNVCPPAKLPRTELGVLEVVLHSNNGSLVFDADTHEEFVGLFRAIGQ